MLSAYIGLRTMGVDPYYLKPFSEASTVLAGHGICSSACVLSCGFYWGTSGHNRFILYLLMNIGGLFVIWTLGAAY